MDMATAKRVIRCHNCGAILQCDNKNETGYISKSIIENGVPKIPYCNSCCYVFCLIFSDYNTHSSVLHFPYHTVNYQFSVSLHTSTHCLLLVAIETWDLLDSIKIPDSSPCFRIIFAADSSACYRMKFDFCSIQYSN